MLTGGTILEMMPWVILAPALPLLLIFMSHSFGNGKQFSMIMLCVITILSNVFLVLAARSEVQETFLQVSFIADFIFTLLLLKSCTDHRILKYSIFTIILVFLGIYITNQLLSTGLSPVRNMIFAGAMIIFLIAMLVLVTLTGNVYQNLSASPDFWYSGGIFFHFGLLSLLLFTGKKVTDIDYHEHNDLSALYTIIFCMQFLFFSIGVYFHKPWNLKGKKLI